MNNHFHLVIKTSLGDLVAGNKAPNLHDNTDQAGGALPAANATNKKIFPS